MEKPILREDVRAFQGTKDGAQPPPFLRRLIPHSRPAPSVTEGATHGALVLAPIVSKPLIRRARWESPGSRPAYGTSSAESLRTRDAAETVVFIPQGVVPTGVIPFRRPSKQLVHRICHARWGSRVVRKIGVRLPRPADRQKASLPGNAHRRADTPLSHSPALRRMR